MVIQQTVENPASRRITVEVPREIPVGPVILTFTPAPAANQKPGGPGKSDTPVFGGTGADEFKRRSREPDPELAAIIQEATERTERRRTDPVYRAEIEKIWKDLQDGGPIFDGRDGMEVQQEMRDEWPD